MSKSLMIVDDSATMRKIVMRTVRMSGIKFDDIAEAGNGVEALAKLQEKKFDAVLCDVNMPEMDGREFVQKVRGDASYNAVKIVMVSTESAEEFIEELMQTGANEYITKPFTPDKFQDKLAPLLN